MNDDAKTWIKCRCCGNQAEGRNVYEDPDILTVECESCGSIYKEHKATGKSGTDPLIGVRNDSVDGRRTQFFINMQLPGFE